MKNLGYANGWAETPEEVVRCQELKHPRWSRNLGRCDNEYGCDVCDFKYQIDSSD